MCHQVLQLGWSIFFNPWHLYRLIAAYDNLWTFCAMCTVFWTDRVGRLGRLGDGSVVHCSVVHDVVLRFGMYVISQLRFAGKFFHGKLPIVPDCCSKIGRRQSNYTLGQQTLVAVRHISSWVTFIMKGET